ncbi:DUF6262 family protein [Streptomyces sp. NPDC002730]|uniref:DUF6262 family protein n=1 Tax=Streptomyces sp. NPDC002730 TaxID=3364662 RepID=UPI0036B6CB5D
MKRTPAAERHSRDARVERLRASRVQDSEVKTARTLAVVRDLLSAGRRITIAQVARDASVSTWFIYNQPQVRDAVLGAMTTQREQGLSCPAPRGGQQLSPAGLQTEVALARDEIKDLKKERDRLRERVQLALGAELEDTNRSHLIDRVQELERQNAALSRELAEARDSQTVLEQRLRTSEDELAAARTGLRRAMRAVPNH